MERWRRCEWGEMGPVELQHRRQLDRMGGHGPYHCRRNRRGKCRHRHCVVVNSILYSRMTQRYRCTVVLFPVGDTELFARQRGDPATLQATHC